MRACMDDFFSLLLSDYLCICSRQEVTAIELENPSSIDLNDKPVLKKDELSYRLLVHPVPTSMLIFTESETFETTWRKCRFRNIG